MGHVSRHSVTQDSLSGPGKVNADPPIPSRFPVKFPYRFDHFPNLVIIFLIMIHVPSCKAQTLPGQFPVLRLPREPSCAEAAELQAAASEVCLCPYTAVSVVSS